MPTELRAAPADPSSPLSLVARHPRLATAGLIAAGVLALVGSLIPILALELPAWLLLGPALLAVIAFGSAVAVARGSLGALSRAYARPELERRILDLAARFGGRLTVGLTARELSISLSEAEESLMCLARAGHVDIDNEPESGAVIYVFRDLDAHLHPTASPAGLR